VRPAVVNISSIKKIQVAQRFQRMPDMFHSSPFRDFFGDQFFDKFFYPQQQDRGYVQKGLGTGVIIADKGYILTNNHVIADADEITVKLQDGRTHKAEVIGTDPKTDLAVIRIKAKNLVAAPLGDSDDLKVGQWVVAVGNPFGLAQTVTTGIVSAKGRTNLGIVDYEDFIQTDAAINPGNSGGPLVNLKGEVVGINAAIFRKSGGYMGVGFAIPVNMVKSVVDSLTEKGRVVRGWLGVAIQDLDTGLAQSFGYEDENGALVSQVTPDSPGAKAGIEAGDIIVQYNGKEVANSQRLRSAVSATKPGARIKLVVVREGKQETLTVKIGELEDDSQADQGQMEIAQVGLTVKTLTSEMAREMGYGELKGVMVMDLDPLALAASAGLQVNDIIVSVHGMPVTSARMFWSELRKHDLAQGVRLTVQTGAYRRFVLLKVRE
jgi:serine protease Do